MGEPKSPDRNTKGPDVDQVLKELEERTQNDYLNIRGDKQLIRFLAQHTADHQHIEKVKFSDSCVKINKRDKQQERDFVVTTYAIYNFMPGNYKKPKREIPIASLRGIVIDNTSDEILLQVSDDYDYRVSVVRKADVLRIVNEIYKEFTGSKLKVRLTDDIGHVQLATKADVRKSTDNRVKTVASRRSVHTRTTSNSEDLEDRPRPKGASSRRDSSSNGKPVSNVTGGKTQSVSMQGWLAKKGVAFSVGVNTTVWKRRYFRLSETNLLYYEARLKGSIPIERGGTIRTWKNKRISVDARETSLPPSPNHLRNILRDPERANAFLEYTKSIYSPENVTFYLAVEEYRKLEDHSAEQKETAKKIYRKYVRPSADMEVSAPLTVREDLGDVITSGVINRTSFDTVQNMVLQQMKINEFPSYLQYSKQKNLESEDFKIKKEMNKADKEKEACDNCLSKFSLIKRKNFCRYCGDILCAACLSKTTTLPVQYGISEPVKVCDMCHAVLEQAAPAYTFSYASKSGGRPVNLAANDPDELESWLTVFRDMVSEKEKEKESERVSVSHAKTPMKSIKESGKEKDKEKEGETDDGAEPSITGEDDEDEDSREGEETHGGTSEGGETSHGPKKSITQTKPRSRSKARELGHKEGWLLKEDQQTKTWKSRYMILHEGRLYTYELNLRGSVSLAEGAGVHADLHTKTPTLTDQESNKDGLISTSNFRYHLIASVKSRLYNLAADTKAERDQWIDAIENAIRKAPRQIPDYAQAYAQAAPEGEVTFVFTDVQNSTNLWEAASTAMNKSLKIHDNLLRMLLKQFRGYEVKTEGDAFMVTFFNVGDAVRWCLNVQKALCNSTWPQEMLQQSAASRVMGKNGQVLFNGLRIRMGIHTGHPNCRRNPITGRMDYFGPVVNRSARVADSSNGGQIVCTEEVFQKIEAAQASGTFDEPVQIELLGKYPYKGLQGLVAVYQLSPNELLERREHWPGLRIKEKAEEEKGKEPERARRLTLSEGAAQRLSRTVQAEGKVDVPDVAIPRSRSDMGYDDAPSTPQLMQVDRELSDSGSMEFTGTSISALGKSLGDLGEEDETALFAGSKLDSVPESGVRHSSLNKLGPPETPTRDPPLPTSFSSPSLQSPTQSPAQTPSQTPTSQTPIGTPISTVSTSTNLSQVFNLSSPSVTSPRATPNSSVASTPTT